MTPAVAIRVQFSVELSHFILLLSLSCFGFLLPVFVCFFILLVICRYIPVNGYLWCCRSRVGGRLVPATNHAHPYDGLSQVLRRRDADPA